VPASTPRISPNCADAVRSLPPDLVITNVSGAAVPTGRTPAGRPWFGGKQINSCIEPLPAEH
jgi:hypothetical protein